MMSVSYGTILIGLLEIKDNEIGVTMPRLFDEFFLQISLSVFYVLYLTLLHLSFLRFLCAWEVAGIEPMNVTVDVN